MNIRMTLSAALAATALLALAPAQAQAPTISSSQLESKVQAMQSQINALQAQVKQLQQQLIQTRALAGLPNPGVSPFYRVPNTLPNLTLPNLTLPNAPGVSVAPMPPRRFSNIPDCQITLLKAAR